MRRALSLLAALAALGGAPPAFASGPVTKGPWVQQLGPTSAVVRVELESPGPVTVELGISSSGAPDGGGRRFESAEATTLHSIAVTDLQPATRYTYTLRASGAQKYGALTTAPREDAGAPFRFLVYGDNRSDDAAHAAVVRAMMPVPADFVVNTGDLVTEGGDPRDWQTFFDIEAPLLRERCVFVCVGNHELIDTSGVEFLRYFGPTVPKARDAAAPLTPDMLSSTFRWSNARFFLMNGMVQYRTGATRAWLERVLSDADNESGLAWRIVVVHHGPWSSGPHGDNQLLLDANVPEIFRRHKIDLVIAGHDHIYERGAKDGLPYLISGGGGAPTYKVKAQPHARKCESVRHFVEAVVSHAAIQFVATRVDGTTIERCALRKEPAGWDCDGEAPSTAKSTPVSAGPEAPSAASKCGCTIVGKGGARDGALAGAFAVLVVAASARRRRRDVTR